MEESLNILNLILYKYNSLSAEGQCNIPEKYVKMFPIFVYMVLGIPQELGNSNISQQYQDILVNLCVNPDEDTICNIIGLFRNYSVCLGGQGLRNNKD